ncbi:YihY/virulence factor BrkB family protein [Streptomyces yunnanensis]|uniref:YihY/virulence factor BrkB family protein n=1 Tax=Streptomyces yunnanensis TaxID=156453 RepID=A0ABY8A7Z4_9ACTN|nr:YihY/virulence factor BrkB family protein [Streptomyces yunnanensis]WEB40819.1 YihY/virulence factor BrkB family protein [Streptomyces yunnanensis]
MTGGRGTRGNGDDGGTPAEDDPTDKHPTDEHPTDNDPTEKGPAEQRPGAEGGMPDRVSRLPIVGPLLVPVVRRLLATHLWRSYERIQRVHWTRLAAAITFTSFIALFPLLTVGAAIVAATIGKDQLHKLEDKLSEQIPGIAAQLDLAALVQNAGTVGLIAGAVLLFTGIGWVQSLRDCLRAVWEAPAEDVNFLFGKVRDGVLLLGLGGVALVSLGSSAFASAAVDRAVEAIGLPQGGAVSILLTVAGFCTAVLADFLMLAYILTKLAGAHPPRRALVVASLIGAIGFEVLKLLLSGYLRGVAARSMYGAFGTPVALLLWINFTAKLLVFCASWTATERVAPGAGAEPAAAAGT